jgi:hypothetical protein
MTRYSALNETTGNLANLTQLGSSATSGAFFNATSVSPFAELMRRKEEHKSEDVENVPLYLDSETTATLSTFVLLRTTIELREFVCRSCIT